MRGTPASLAFKVSLKLLNKGPSSRLRPLRNSSIAPESTEAKDCNVGSRAIWAISGCAFAI